MFIVNDTFSEITETLKISHIDFSGNLLFEEKQLISSPINSSSIAYKYAIQNKEFNKINTLLKISFGEIEYFHYFSKPKELELEIKEISITTIKNEEGFIIKLQSGILQKNVFLYTKEKGIWSDNYFDLLPGIVKEIQLKTDTKKLPKINIKTLNKIIKN